MSQTDAQAEDVKWLMERLRKPIPFFASGEWINRERTEAADSLERLSNELAATSAANHGLSIIMRRLELQQKGNVNEGTKT